MTHLKNFTLFINTNRLLVLVLHLIGYLFVVYNATHLAELRYGVCVLTTAGAMIFVLLSALLSWGETEGELYSNESFVAPWMCSVVCVSVFAMLFPSYLLAMTLVSFGLSLLMLTTTFETAEDLFILQVCAEGSVKG